MGMDTNSLKTDILRLAGYLGPSESLTVIDATRSLREVVASVVTQANPITVALIAVELAIRLDAE